MESTEAYFRKHNFFGLQSDNVSFFEQHMLPCMTFEGKIILETVCKVARAPGTCGSMQQPAVHDYSTALWYDLMALVCQVVLLPFYCRWQRWPVQSSGNDQSAGWHHQAWHQVPSCLLRGQHPGQNGWPRLYRLLYQERIRLWCKGTMHCSEILEFGTLTVDLPILNFGWILGVSLVSWLVTYFRKNCVLIMNLEVTFTFAS